MNNKTSDKTLVIRLKRADGEAFQELYHKYVQKLYAFTLKTAKSAELAEDIVHDVFVKIWENRHKIDPGQSFQAYIFTIARNQLLNFIKRKAHEKDIIEQMLKKAVPIQKNNTLEQVSYNESTRLFHEAVEQLPEKRKEVFRLCHLEGFTYQETADQLGLTSSTVNSQMVKAWKSIREHLHAEDAISLPE